MALGDSVLSNVQSRTGYVGSNTDLIGKAFDALLTSTMTNSDITSQLQGSEGSDKPFIIRRELEKGAMDTISFNVDEDLGQSGRRGDDLRVNFEENLFHATWSVQIDHVSVVVAYNELVRGFATSGGGKTDAWRTRYATKCGKRMGQIEQEDMLARMRMRSSALNTVRPGQASSLDTLKWDDTFDTDTLGAAGDLAKGNGVSAASIGKMDGGGDLEGFIVLGANYAVAPIRQDPAWNKGVTHAQIQGPKNPLFSGNIPDWEGHKVLSWNVRAHANPGPIGSTVIPEALLGDAVADATTATTIYGGGRTQSALGSVATLYKPFEHFYGNTKLFGKSIDSGTDSGTYYFLIIDPADLKWTMFSYTGSNIASNGNNIVTTSHLGATASSARVTTLGNVTYDSTVNKVAFPTGSRIVQCNANGVPVSDLYLFGRNAGAKCYGINKNLPIENDGDYGALKGKGILSTFGCDLAKDTLGSYHRGFVRIQCAYRHPLGRNLPQL